MVSKKNEVEKKDKALEESFAVIKKAAAESKTAESGKNTKAAPKKAAAKAEGKAAVKTAKKAAAPKKSTEKTEPVSKLVFEFNGRQIDVAAVEKKAVAAAKKKKKDLKSVEVYVVANQNAAYYVIDGEGKDDYRIEL